MRCDERQLNGRLVVLPRDTSSTKIKKEGPKYFFGLKSRKEHKSSGTLIRGRYLTLIFNTYGGDQDRRFLGRFLRRWTRQRSG